jgi:hypothetical protein
MMPGGLDAGAPFVSWRPRLVLLAIWSTGMPGSFILDLLLPSVRRAAGRGQLAA